MPGGREQAHAAHALDGLEHVDRTAHGPPAVTRGLHEGEAAAQLLAVEGRRVGDEPTAGDIEAQQRQPVLDPGQRYETAVPRMGVSSIKSVFLVSFQKVSSCDETRARLA